MYNQNQINTCKSINLLPKLHTAGDYIFPIEARNLYSEVLHPENACKMPTQVQNTNV